MEKQETIEKAAETWSNDRVANGDEKNIACYQNGFIDGAKWQAKQMYSEDEVFNLWNWLNDGFIIRKSLPTKEELLGWFEQFKKNLK
jgi:hypothetical protein